MRELPALEEGVYEHLRAIATRIHAERGRGQATLQPTDLVHEAWIKLERGSGAYATRQHFVAVAARAMRQILVDRDRARSAQKRGGGAHRVTLAGEGTTPEAVVDLLDLDDALNALREIDEEVAAVAELRIFGGLSPEEAGEVIGVSERTAKRRWRFGKAFLASRLEADPDPIDEAGPPTR